MERSALESAGETIYQTQCSTCHGTTRAGSPPDYPSLVDVKQRRSSHDIAAIVVKGKGRMPGFQALTPEQLEEIVLFLERDEPKNDRTEMAPAKSGAASGSAGAAVYATKCAVCHGEHMEGRAPKYPSLKEAPQIFSRAQVIDRIQHGSSRMPASPEIQGAELDALIAYIGFGETPTSEVKAPQAVAAADEGDGPSTRYRFTGLPEISGPGWLSGGGAAVGNAERDRSEHGKICVEDSAGRISGACGAWAEEDGLGKLWRAGGDGGRHRIHRRDGVRRKVSCVRQRDWGTAVGSAASVSSDSDAGDLHGGRKRVCGDRVRRWGKIQRRRAAECTSHSR